MNPTFSHSTPAPRATPPGRFRALASGLLALSFLGSASSPAQLQLVPDGPPPAIFAGSPQQVRVLFHNPTDQPVTTELKWRLYQITSTLRAPVGEMETWKTLVVLPGQTVLETFPLTLPELRAATRFEIHWNGLGRTPVHGYPPGLLQALPPLKLHDPDGHLPMLRDAEEEPPRLWVVWAKELPEDRPKGLPIVWIKPSATAVAVVRGTVVEAPEQALAGLADSPSPQLNLIRFAEWAVSPPPDNLP